jgi:methionyl aminopeptidase
MGVIIKSPRQIDGLRRAGRLVAETFEVLRERIAPGITTGEIDRLAEEFIRARGATPIYKGYRPFVGSRSRERVPFPATVCVAVNEVICHGIPSLALPLRQGDIIGLDIGVLLDGWVGDSCVTFPVGRVDGTARRLMETTSICLALSIDQCAPGKHLGDIGAAIQAYAESQGFSVVREYVGHGVGRLLHEEPSVTHYGEVGTGLELKPGMVFTIEPMINEGRPETVTLDDGWTVCTRDGRRSAQFEHMVAITPGGHEILSALA